ncbi:hypothetical protein [Lewinella sp. 4G2]|uniref:hypothetical protein n=1 Tax=Lewinella sp. 4G2 TaxID=1803372 RepID=UPI0007B48C9E|nr:hypothetical protein [Lewinella sp. 4G2]OAV44931.1 hypothetical protein A3850_010685 [Lewinella sp. 4G2]
MQFLLPVLLIFALSQVPGKGQAQNWTLEHDEDGVKVYVRPEANEDMSVRVETSTSRSVADVQAVIDEVGTYPEWVHRCGEAYRVDGGSDDNYVYYSLIDMPFPFSDKEVVARINQSIDAETGTLTRVISSEPEAVPPVKGRDRLATYEAEWKVSPTADGRVSIICTCRTAAGAGLPNWLRKEIMTGGPAKTVANLVERLEAR